MITEEKVRANYIKSEIEFLAKVGWNIRTYGDEGNGNCFVTFENDHGDWISCENGAGGKNLIFSPDLKSGSNGVSVSNDALGMLYSFTDSFQNTSDLEEKEGGTNEVIQSEEG